MKKKDVAKLSRKKLERLQEQIVDELEQYKEIDEKRDGRKRERENYQDWKQREKIPLIGRAYIGKVEEITIAHTSIKGNAGETYEFNVIGTPAMDYFLPTRSALSGVRPKAPGLLRGPHDASRCNTSPDFKVHAPCSEHHTGWFLLAAGWFNLAVTG